MNLVIYTMVDCAYCIRAKNLLEELGIPYREIKRTQFKNQEYPFFYISGMWYDYENFNALMAKYMMYRIKEDLKK